MADNATAFFQAYDDVIVEVARKASSSHPGIETDDIAQEIRLAFLEEDGLIDKAAAQPALVSHVARVVAGDYCAKERYAYTFHSAQWVYTPAEVRALFEEAFFDDTAWEDAPRKECDHRLDVTAGGVVVALWDLKGAYGKLKPLYRDVIAKRYGSPEDLTPTEKNTLTRAIETATRHLNRKIVNDHESREDHEGPGSRLPFAITKTY